LPASTPSPRAVPHADSCRKRCRARAEAPTGRAFTATAISPVTFRPARTPAVARAGNALRAALRRHVFLQRPSRRRARRGRLWPRPRNVLAAASEARGRRRSRRDFRPTDARCRRATARVHPGRRAVDSEFGCAEGSECASQVQVDFAGTICADRTEPYEVEPTVRSSNIGSNGGAHRRTSFEPARTVRERLPFDVGGEEAVSRTAAVKPTRRFRSSS